MYSYVGLIIAFPLAGFLILGLFGSRMKSEKLVGTIGSTVVILAFFVASAIFVEMLSLPVEARRHIVRQFSWISAGTFAIDASLQVDQLSILMALIVTGVGGLIHIYSIGYMHGDRGFWRFFAYLNLFMVAMLILVLADNYLVMFVGWEGVGLCSYLLIGFWYEKDFEKGTTGDAAKKAFVVNRIGDFGFLLAMFLLVATFGSLRFDTVFPAASVFTRGDTTMTWITLLLFLGATGKSAQIPLYVWLPDAMAGPTPVSALIHAATMVTAGVYMVARSSILFALAPVSMEVVAIIGALTALYAATIGLVQNDIKKVLAYSTISQLGYMFLGLGVGAFASGLFHVMTHAFFKALLFLGSGAVIHAMHDEQDIQKMGGLKSFLPTTYKTFLVGAIAISGIPPLAGFFSKDEILWKAFTDGSPILWIVGALGAGLTAFYMFRLVSLTFEGTSRFDSHQHHPHEAPKSMTVPLIVLAALSVVGGFVGIPESLGGANSFERFLAPVFEPARSKMLLPFSEPSALEYVLMIVSVGIAVTGIYFARRIYLVTPEIAEKAAHRFPRIYRLLLNKYFVDEAYDASVVTPIVKGSQRLLWKGVDVGFIDGTINFGAKATEYASQFFRRVQTGVVQTYAMAFVAGILFILGWLIIR
ncbi:MAG TPA: NADH-quinone oxidoreductase subunit L [Bacteroidota bacterium]|nr:NADH-quinone oxidoreductase subunit L [Bacteroidota bacterium]